MSGPQVESSLPATSGTAMTSHDFEAVPLQKHMSMEANGPQVDTRLLRAAKYCASSRVGDLTTPRTHTLEPRSRTRVASVGHTPMKRLPQGSHRKRHGKLTTSKWASASHGPRAHTILKPQEALLWCTSKLVLA